jgi:hypothetical protein
MGRIMRSNTHFKPLRTLIGVPQSLELIFCSSIRQGVRIFLKTLLGDSPDYRDRYADARIHVCCRMVGRCAAYHRCRLFAGQSGQGGC